jgi:CRISPR-associated protein Csm1
MDADSLGTVVHSLLENATDLKPLQNFSERLDNFFAQTLDKEMEKPEWDSIYTVFSGGDDLLLVGSWNILFSFALHVRTLFQRTFYDQKMTISGGMAIVSRKTPIYRAVEQAEHLLESAKQAGRDRFAAFGQVWEWKHHESIRFAANNLTDWVKGNTAERGWLQTLLQMTERQATEPLTAARLAYHVERNYPPVHDNNPQKQALRGWTDHRIRDFDRPDSTDTHYLSAILRYALTATRKGELD